MVLFSFYLCIFRKFNKIFAQEVLRTCEGPRCQVIQRTGCKRGTGSWMGEKWLGREAQKGGGKKCRMALNLRMRRIRQTNWNVKSRNCFHNFLFLPMVSWLSGKLWEAACAHLHLEGSLGKEWRGLEPVWRFWKHPLYAISDFPSAHFPSAPTQPTTTIRCTGVLSAVFEMMDLVSRRDPGGQTGHHRACRLLRPKEGGLSQQAHGYPGNAQGAPSSKFSSQTCLLKQSDFFFLSSEITSQMLCLQIRQNFNLLLDSPSSISSLFLRIVLTSGELATCYKKVLMAKAYISSIPLHSNSIPHHLSLIKLALKWKHPSPCVHCEKFLGFVSWIFHGKQNRIFSPRPPQPGRFLKRLELALGI